MAIVNEELMHAFFPKHLFCAWRQQESNKIETDEEGKQRGVNKERSKACTKKNPNSLSQPNQNTIKNKHNIAAFYKIWNKYNEIQLTKKINLDNQEMKNHPSSHNQEIICYLHC